MSREADNLVTWFCMFAGFILVLAFASESIDFQQRCDAKCGDAEAVTPFIGFRETCFCSEGQGRWRRENVTEVTSGG